MNALKVLAVALTAAVVFGPLSVRAADPNDDPVAAAFGGKYTAKDFTATTPAQADELRGGFWVAAGKFVVSAGITYVGNQLYGNAVYGSGNYGTLFPLGKIGPIPKAYAPGPSSYQQSSAYRSGSSSGSSSSSRSSGRR